MSDDPLTPLLSMAAQLHEMFSAYVDVGFTRAEALQIVIATIVNTTKGKSE